MHLDWNTTISVIGAASIAAFFRSSVDWSDALVAMPLLSLLIPAETAVPFAILLSITVSVVLILHERHKVVRQSALQFISHSLIGLPIGLLISAFLKKKLLNVDLLNLMAHLFSGQWVTQVSYYYVASLPFIMTAILLGRWMYPTLARTRMHLLTSFKIDHDCVQSQASEGSLKKSSFSN